MKSGLRLLLGCKERTKVPTIRASPASPNPPLRLEPEASDISAKVHAAGPGTLKNVGLEKRKDKSTQARSSCVP
eukprot:1147704-Pelagomonas_calceolata.AAC.4